MDLSYRRPRLDGILVSMHSTLQLFPWKCAFLSFLCLRIRATDNGVASAAGEDDDGGGGGGGAALEVIAHEIGRNL